MMKKKMPYSITTGAGEPKMGGDMGMRSRGSKMTASASKEMDVTPRSTSKTTAKMRKDMIPGTSIRYNESGNFKMGGCVMAGRGGKYKGMK